MSRDHKILAGVAVLSTIVAVVKAAPTSTDDAVTAIKGEAVPLAINLGGLFLLMKMIK